LALKYSIDKIFKVKSIFLQLGTSFIDKQYRTPKNVDYVAAPNAYFLINFDLGFVVPIKNQSITFNLVVDNLLNTTYRDYLNRFRYYSDELGRNISLKIKVPFNIIQAK
jgi:iron complex outermembrane receptor protein